MLAVPLHWDTVCVPHQLPRVSPDVQQQLVPPRFLEKFTPKKVKKGASITFSVKVEGRALRLPSLLRTPGGSEQILCPH